MWHLDTAGFYRVGIERRRPRGGQRLKLLPKLLAVTSDERSFQLGRRTNDVQRDSVVAGDSDGPGGKASIGDHHRFVGGDLLLYLLQEQHLGLIDLIPTPPLRVRDVKVECQLGRSLPQEIDLMLIRREIGAARIRNQWRRYLRRGNTEFLREKEAAQLLVLLTLHDDLQESRKVSGVAAATFATRPCGQGPPAIVTRCVTAS